MPYFVSGFTTKNRVFLVNIGISNKPAARDPEGETIQHDLVSKSGFAQVRKIRVGKLLQISVDAPTGEDAENLVLKMCDELRIYNPAAHQCKVIGESSQE
jgi:phosphoribosylformylglycinamidine synthase subunit PurS